MFAHLRRLALAAVMLAGWAGAAQAKAPFTVVSIRPLHSIVAAVMKGAGAPHLLIRDGSSVHHYALRPSDARALAKAGLVVIVDYGLEHFLLGRLPALAGKARIVQAGELDGVKLLGRRPLNPPGTGSPGAGMTHNAINWHIWLDPDNASAIARGVAEILAGMDAPHAALYRGNARAFSRLTGELTKKLAARLAPVRGKPFIVAHDATRYFEARFGLRAIAAIEPAGEGAPGTLRMLSLVTLARKHPGICVFVTPDAPARWASLLKREAGARPAVIDPAGMLLAPGEALYPRLLENLGNAFARCLAGGK